MTTKTQINFLIREHIRIRIKKTIKISKISTKIRLGNFLSSLKPIISKIKKIRL